MKLLLDLGNSRLKWAWQGADQLVSPGAAGHRDESLDHVLATLAPPDGSAGPGEIRLVSTAGAELGGAVLQGLGRRFGCPVLQAISPPAAAGLQNGYHDPAQLGPDRWLAMRAARTVCPGNLCVVDAGTATTIDLVAAGGLHLGGFIIPGIRLMHSSLMRETGDLARLSGRGFGEAGLVPDGQSLAGREYPPLGRDTGGAIHWGVIGATAALARRALASLDPVAGAPRLVLTGGEAELLIPGLPPDLVHRPQLVMEGLAMAGSDELRITRAA